MKKFFFNYLKNEYQVECTQQINERWYILVGFAGFNSRENNFDGYETKVKAEYACLCYQLAQ